MRIGALEAGGTKMVCAVCDENGNIFEQESIPTLTPEVTMPLLVDWFRQRSIERLGIACFGPVDLNRKSPTYGYITTTPKLAWQLCDVVGTFRAALGVPVGFDTDVNGSCLGEMHYGAAVGCNSCVYITVGTGIGMGICCDGTLIHGSLHPEAGHLRIPKLPGDTFPGVCPYHGDCLEGLCSGEAVGKRAGKKSYELTPENEAWRFEAFYLAEAVVNLILTVAPEKIIMGGGVMKQEFLFAEIRKHVKELLAGYINTPQMADIDNYIVPAGCGGDQGILGCVILALNA